VDNNKYNFFATTPKGLELLLVDELRALGATDAAEKLAGVTFSGDLALAYKVCLWSRLANRVLLQLVKVPAATPEELYRGVQSIAWDQHLDPSGSIYIHFVTVQSQITHTLFAAQKVKDAIVDQFREKFAARPDVARDRPDVSVHVYLHRDIASISIDLSGESLHRRGYRLEQGVAPLKENLAAAILLRAGWPQIAKNHGTLVDPMCGSGTLLVEAALMAGNIAPGLMRDYFGFLRWKQHDPALWERLVSEAKQQQVAIASKIVGYDCDAEVVTIAIANVERAGLRGIVHVEKRDVTACVTNQEWQPGLVVVNPPYGERLGEEAALQKLYVQLADQLKNQFQGYRAAIFTGNPELSRNMGLRAERHYALFNGALPCTLLLFQLTPEWFIDRSIKALNERRVRRAQRVLADSQDTAIQMFVNRLTKNLKHLKRWAAREDIMAYRVYDSDLPEYAVSVDLYDQFVLVQEYQAPQSIAKDKVQQRLQFVLAVLPEVLGVSAANIFLHDTKADPALTADDLSEFYPIVEHGAKLLVNLRHDGVPTGLNLDERILRAMIQREAKGKHFLSLMTESASVNVFAAKGGALTTQAIVESEVAVQWAEQQLALNEFAGDVHSVDCVDIERYVQTTAMRFDLIFIEISTEMREDGAVFMQDVVNLLLPGGKIYWVARHPRYKMHNNRPENVLLEDISKLTLPLDYARNPKVHRCWVINN
jgi:23S rRNA (guanine2445-N2)-methyltransferase / 23S rRNA (guanine2069-N7)-methyltransferase